MQDVHQKTQNFMLISKLLKKSAKRLLRKKWSAEKLQNNGVFAFYYFVQKFSAYIFFFSIEFCVLWYPDRIFATHFLTYIRIQLYIHFRPGWLHFDKKSKNRCTLMIRWSDVPNIFQRFLLLSSLSEFYQEGQVYESGLRSVFEAARKSSF